MYQADYCLNISNLFSYMLQLKSQTYSRKAEKNCNFIKNTIPMVFVTTLWVKIFQTININIAKKCQNLPNFPGFFKSM